jgi:hypothetical protein
VFFDLGLNNYSCVVVRNGMLRSFIRSCSWSLLKVLFVVKLILFDLAHRSNHLYPKQGFNKDHSEVYSAWLDDLLQFQQVKWNFSYCGKFYLKRENSPDFLCMNAMHTLVFSHFIASKPGILQPLPLKLNFVPKFERSHVSECGTDLNRSRSFQTPWWS